MKVKILEVTGPNEGTLNVSQQEIVIKKGRFIMNETSHPLYSETEKYFKRIHCLEHNKKSIYSFNKFGTSAFAFHIDFNWFEHQQFKWLQGRHWFQKEENLWYSIKLFFLILGVLIAIKD